MMDGSELPYLSDIEEHAPPPPAARGLHRLRYRLESGFLKVWARLETDDAWRLLYQTSAACAEKTVSMPAPPGRSSSFYLKIEGSGACAIMALSESYEAGSDV